MIILTAYSSARWHPYPGAIGTIKDLTTPIARVCPCCDAPITEDPRWQLCDDCTEADCDNTYLRWYGPCRAHRDDYWDRDRYEDLW